MLLTKNVLRGRDTFAEFVDEVFDLDASVRLVEELV